MFVNWIEGTGGWSKLGGFRGPNSYCWVESVVSESYDSTVTFEAGGINDNMEGILNITVFENPGTSDKPVNISFEISESKDIEIDIYDLNGNEIVLISKEKYNAGIHNVIWNGLDGSGEKIGTGTYFIIFKTDNKEYVSKIIRK
jgi:flagellar hook assembly protein FlgD